jgi:hypothetical protein
MPDPTIFELLSKQMDAGFARLDSRGDDIASELRKINVRVGDAVASQVGHGARLESAEESLRIVRERTHLISNTLQKQERVRIMRDIGIIAATALTLKFLKSWVGL